MIVIRQFASDDATVVVGTVIDPEMSDEIRVTLVATGLEGDAVTAAAPAAGTQAKPRPALRPVELEETIPQKIAVGEGRAASGRGVYEQRASFESGVLDIPAFLRNQAD